MPEPSAWGKDTVTGKVTMDFPGVLGCDRGKDTVTGKVTLDFPGVLGCDRGKDTVTGKVTMDFPGVLGCDRGKDTVTGLRCTWIFRASLGVTEENTRSLGK